MGFDNALNKNFLNSNYQQLRVLLPPQWVKTSDIAATVIVTRAYGSLTTAAFVTSCLEQIKLLRKNSKMISRVGLTIVTSKLGVLSFGMPHNEVELRTAFKSYTLTNQTQTHTWIERLKTYASNLAGQFMPLIQYNSHFCSYWKTDGMTMFTGFPRTRWPTTAVQWEIYGTNVISNLRASCFNDWATRCCSVLHALVVIRGIWNRLWIFCGDYIFGVLDLHPRGMRDIVYDQSENKNVASHVHEQIHL